MDQLERFLLVASGDELTGRHRELRASGGMMRVLMEFGQRKRSAHVYSSGCVWHEVF